MAYTPTILLFNGPPRCGKDTATNMVRKLLGDRARHYRFANPLKEAVHALFGMAGINVEQFDHYKDKSSSLFHGMTPREAYIWMSEQVVKPKFGKQFFAEVAVNAISQKIVNNGIRTVVVSDCGFQEEFDILSAHFGSRNVWLCKIERPGYTFEGDSRSYIQSKHGSQIVVNGGTLPEFEEKINQMVGVILNASN